ncbi:uncharacterized protein EV422DRAFT_325446 [Fimicolochytrium jonesii]|uniref:uncharacterized protein n=1 Tax=Fimicolochytrium jonesii TaxID=1396493 RepID=UPI0022FDC136|nr:uncharacterized protein EV422DRAFT_325446 [Fimicolochytrium jonesii]KAI8824563.1 hypothetical protein EV422DRAFT_325446 [Fimicolochytrium jonesii]
MSTQPETYLSRITSMRASFLTLADLTVNADDWTTVALLQTPPIQVHKRKDTNFCLRVVADLNCTPECAFDLMADITRRREWDDLCEEAGIVEIIDNATKVQFLKAKGVWPASPRDTLTLAHVEQLPDGRYLNIAQSISHPRYPPRDAEGIVRMDAKISGQIIGPSPDCTDGSMCRVVQVADADLKGWIPKSVIGFVATKSLPNSFKKLDSILRITEQRTVSEVITLAESDESQPPHPSLTQPLPDLPIPTSVSTTPSAAYLPVVAAAPAARRRTLWTKLRNVLDWWNPYLIFFYFLLKAYKLATGRKLIGGA